MSIDIEKYNIELCKLSLLNKDNLKIELNKIKNLKKLLTDIITKSKCDHAWVVDMTLFDPCISYYKCSKCNSEC